MIHLVTTATRHAYERQLAELARSIAWEATGGAAFARVKELARPRLEDDDGFYVMMLTPDGAFHFGVSLRPTLAANAYHHRLTELAQAASPQLWECLFFTDRSHPCQVEREALAGLWVAALEAAERRGARRLAGLELSGCRTREIIFELDIDPAAIASARAMAGPQFTVLALDAATAARVRAEEVERLLARVAPLGAPGYGLVRNILERARAIAAAGGPRRAIERLERGVLTYPADEIAGPR